MGYSQKMPNGVLGKPESLTGRGPRRTKINPTGIANGEDSKGFTAFTPNGVSRVSLDTLVHGDNYGKREDGDHYDYTSVIAPAGPRD